VEVGKMLLGVGTDILSIDRIRQCLDSPAFMRRTFTEGEISVGNGRSDEAAYYARIFAAKEAVFKCVGMAPDDLGSWLNIEVFDSEQAQPEVRLGGTVAEIAEARCVKRVMLSVSSDDHYSVAFAAVVGEERDGD
jgi:holo-[acyl-carrier protein] synthase